MFQTVVFCQYKFYASVRSACKRSEDGPDVCIEMLEEIVNGVLLRVKVLLQILWGL